jgi:hypothetical protein
VISEQFLPLNGPDGTLSKTALVYYS